MRLNYEQALSIIHPKYKEPWRVYHTWEHIEDGFVYIEEFVDGQVDTDIFDALNRNLNIFNLAWMMHDVIYVPKNPYNELASAMTFSKVAFHLDPLVDSNSLDLGHDLIMCTKNHFPNEEGSKDLYLLSKLICDIDLAGFSTQHDKNKRNVYEEFKGFLQLPDFDEQWRTGQTVFLQSLLDRERIFHTEYFYKIHEENARKNIQSEIDSYK